MPILSVFLRALWRRRTSLRPYGSGSEPNRRQLAARCDRRLVHQTPGFKQLQQLFACRLVVPFAVPPDDLEQLVRRAFAIALRRQRDREVEARLVIVGVGRDRLLERRELTDIGRLLRQPQSRPGRRDRRILLARSRRGSRLEQRSGLSQLSSGDLKLGETTDRLRLRWVFGQNLRIDISGAGRVAFGRRLFRLREKRGRAALERPDQPLDEAANLALRQGADEAVDRLALVKSEDSGDR